MNNPKNKLGIAIVGCGAIARTNAKAVQASGNARFTYAVDVNLESAKELGNNYSVPFTDRVEEALSARDVEAVFICTPHYLHAPVAERATAAGKHVVVEKPMGASLDQARAIVHYCRAAGVKLAVCYCMRFSEKIRLARKFAEAGGLGEPAGIQIEMLRDRTESFMARDTWQEGNANWHAIKAKSGGGMFADNFSHYLDYFRYITGKEALSVSCVAKNRVIRGDVEDTLWASIRYEGGVMGTVIAASAVPGSGCELDERSVNSLQRVWGDAGQMVLLPELGLFSLRRAAGFTPNRWHYPRPRRVYNSGGAGIPERKNFIDDFADAVRSGNAPAVKGEDGLRVMEIVDAAYRSASKNGEEVRIDRS